MRIGVLVMPTDPWPVAVATAQRLESLGYHHLWVYDHLAWRRYSDRPWHAIYPWLTGVAATTKRIRLGTMVANPNIRHPMVLARDAMTIDHVSNGRLTIGLGAGGTGFDATILGQEPLSPGQRIDRLREFASLYRQLFRSDVTDHSGVYYEVQGGRMLPGCVQSPHVPLAIAAGGQRALRVVAELGDAWITYGDTSTHDVSDSETESIVADQWEQIERRCAQIGRDPRELDRIYLIGNTRARPLQSIDAFDDFLGRYASLGFTDLVFHHPRADDPVWNEDPEIIDQIADRYLDPT